ncbi:MAG: GNAT family N-acetyltransferase [Micromonosporaceae bacterium]
MRSERKVVGVVVYETERLVVRPWTHDGAELDRLYDIYSRWEVSGWLGANPKVLESRELAPAIVDRWLERSRPDQCFGVWAVQVRQTGVVAGTVLLVPLPDGDGEIEVGWHFHPDSWGHGYATEAARGAIEHGFAHGLTEVYAVVRPDNARSLAVCRRLGMTPLGPTQRWYGVPLEAFRLERQWG